MGTIKRKSKTVTDRQWRQRVRSFVLVGGALAFLSGFLVPATNMEDPAERVASTQSTLDVQ